MSDIVSQFIVVYSAYSSNVLIQMYLFKVFFKCFQLKV